MTKLSYMTFAHRVVIYYICKLFTVCVTDACINIEHVTKIRINI